MYSIFMAVRNRRRRHLTAKLTRTIFEIQKGVTIALFMKRPDLARGVWYGELWGRQLDKYRELAHREFAKQNWLPLEPVTPFYLLVPQDPGLWSEYEEGWSVPEILPVNVLGFQTHRDHFAIGWSKKEIESRIADLQNSEMSDRQLRDEYELKESSSWKIASARAAVRENKKLAERIITCAYRPFDERWCLFGNEVMDRPRRELLKHVAGRDNMQLLVPRQIGTDEWRHSFVATAPANDCLISDKTREANYSFPLYRFQPDKVENLSPDFRAFIDGRYDHHYEPEEILGYIYAVLHAPTYRETYAEFLRIDFPRVPFPEDSADFEALSSLGWDLMQKHLLRDVPDFGLGKYEGKGDNAVEKPR